MFRLGIVFYVCFVFCCLSLFLVGCCIWCFRFGWLVLGLVAFQLFRCVVTVLGLLFFDFGFGFMTWFV